MGKPLFGRVYYWKGLTERETAAKLPGEDFSLAARHVQSFFETKLWLRDREANV
jgi:hypothetical protein